MSLYLGIIGAGISGLHSANSLIRQHKKLIYNTNKNLNLNIILIEKKPFVGGLITRSAIPEHTKVREMIRIACKQIDKQLPNNQINFNYFGNISILDKYLFYNIPKACNGVIIAAGASKIKFDPNHPVSKYANCFGSFDLLSRLIKTKNSVNTIDDNLVNSLKNICNESLTIIGCGNVTCDLVDLFTNNTINDFATLNNYYNYARLISQIKNNPPKIINIICRSNICNAKWTLLALKQTLNKKKAKINIYSNHLKENYNCCNIAECNFLRNYMSMTDVHTTINIFDNSVIEEIYTNTNNYIKTIKIIQTENMQKATIAIPTDLLIYSVGICDKHYSWIKSFEQLCENNNTIHQTVGWSKLKNGNASLNIIQSSIATKNLYKKLANNLRYYQKSNHHWNAIITYLRNNSKFNWNSVMNNL